MTMNSSRAVGAGAFVLVGAALFTLALFTIGQRRMLFEDRFELRTEFSKLGQLAVGAVVRVAGMDAGEVADIAIPASPSGKFRVTMKIREELHGLVRTDSTAAMQTEGLVGAIFVNITPGSDAAPRIAVGGTIPGHDPFSMADLLQQTSDTVAMVSQTVEQMRGDIEKAVQQVALTAEDAHGLLEDIRPDITAIAHNGSQISADAQQVLAAVREGKGTIGKLINDPALYDRAKQIAADAQSTVANVKEVSAEARRAISDFRSKDGPAQGLMADMRITIGQAREAVADLSDNMEALKRNFLFRGFFNKRGYFDLDALSPAEYRNGLLEQGRRKAMRIWVSSAVLFDALPDGTEVLTSDGKARLDRAIATFLKYLPEHPLVVEGYASQGTESDRFMQSRHRAGTVREYLLSRHRLAPQATGYIALGKEALGAPGGDTWDGVAITLFADPASLQTRVEQEKHNQTDVAQPLEASR
jgi:phospholipid/cholesterol/gamma-HCH transport system substrate-binding protein